MPSVISAMTALPGIPGAFDELDALRVRSPGSRSSMGDKLTEIWKAGVRASQDPECIDRGGEGDVAEDADETRLLGDPDEDIGRDVATVGMLHRMSASARCTSLL